MAKANKKEKNKRIAMKLLPCFLLLNGNVMSVERQESVMIAHVVHGGSSKSFIPKMHTNLLEEHTMNHSLPSTEAVQRIMNRKEWLESRRAVCAGTMGLTLSVPAQVALLSQTVSCISSLARRPAQIAVLAICGEVFARARVR